MKNSDFLIVIPAYNEEATIKELVTRARMFGDVCVVDDCSIDATPEILKNIQNIHVIRHEKNTHIPGAIMDGLQYANKHKYKYAVTLDSGFSHNPDEIPLFKKAPHSDLLIGSRTIKINTPLYRKFLSTVGNYIYNISLDFPRSIFKKIYYKDITSGFRRYSEKAIALLVSKKMESKSFDFLFESAMFIYKNGFKISEIPISYNTSNSSLNSRVVGDCIFMCLKTIFKPRK